jgi:hypothetical protein
MVYILNIQGEFDVAGRATASIAGAYKEVHLTGTGTVTVAESSTGCIIQTAANQTFIFDGPTLVGKLGNYRAVVYINGGRSEFRSGIIRDNYSRLEPFVENPYVGGGVFINSGTFEMSGGAISGNFTEYCGAGLLVYSGTFKMSGGEIKDNKAHLGCYGHGGGVFINSGGTFEMSGGTISGNIISSLVGGGGVYVGSTAVFNKTGGTIYGEDNASTTSHQSGSLANTNIYELFPGQNGHAVVFNKLYAPRIVSVIYRNNTLGPQDNFTTVGVTTSNLGGFEGYRIINLDE